MRTSYGENLRGFLSEKDILQIIDFTDVHVFDALVASCVIIVGNSCSSEDYAKIVMVTGDFSSKEPVYSYVNRNKIDYQKDKLTKDIWNLQNEELLQIKAKIDANATKVSSLEKVKVYRGITTGFNPAFVINEEQRKEIIRLSPNEGEIIKPLLQGRDIKKWVYQKSKQYLFLTGFDTDIPTEFPLVFKHLTSFKDALVQRDDQGRNWWNLRACKYYPEFEKEKIIWGLTADKWAFAYDNKRHYLPSNGYILTSVDIPIKLILAQLNSNLSKFYFQSIGIITAGGAYTLKHETILELPLIYDTKLDIKIITLVDQILPITKDDDYLGNPDKQAKVKKLENEIDQLVYKLYELTPEEIKIVEEFNGGK